MSNYGDFVARTVGAVRIPVVATAWTPLVVDTTPLKSRRHIRYQLKSNPGGAMAVTYVPKNADGTFTTPTTSVKLCTVYPGNTTVVEPIGDAVQVFGRLVKKKGFTSNSISVVVTEFA